MSKRHKHRYDYELEQRYAQIELQRQFVILILVILMFSDKNNQSNYKIKCKSSNKNSLPYAGGASYYSNNQVENNETGTTNIYYGGDINLDAKPWNKVCVINDETKFNTAPHDTEVDINGRNAEEPVVIHTNVKAYNIRSSECSLQNPFEDCLNEAVSSMPVILSNTNIQVIVEALTQFPEPVFEIKDIDKNVIIKECKLVLGTNKLFIEGIIQESIEYADAEYTDLESVSGSIKSLMFDIPFKCTAKISFSDEPEDIECSSSFEIQLVNGDKSSSYYEVLNKKIYGELESIEILETDIQEEIRFLSSTLPGSYTFEKLSKKVILNLGLNLLQNKKVFISNYVHENSNIIEPKEE
jgi:hypothetical protein